MYVEIHTVHTHTHYKFTHKENYTQHLYLNPSRLTVVIGGESKFFSYVCQCLRNSQPSIMYLVSFLYLPNVKALKRVEEEGRREKGKEKGEGRKKREASDTNRQK